MNLTRLESLPKFSKILAEYPVFKNLGSQEWRLNNLYFIKDKEGNKVRFKPNWAQKELLACKHPCQIILKARQLGITTFYCIKLLDHVLWENFTHCGIIAHTLADAQSLFVDKLKFTFDHLHPALRACFRTVGDSAKELRFSHGSTIRVGTSLRSSTLNHLHISELGKISIKYPEKAREIVTGALQTISPGQHCYVESTAEGSTGVYYDMCMEALKLQQNNVKLNPLDYDFFFFPWFREPAYILNSSNKVIDNEVLKYFETLEAGGVKLEQNQKDWYFQKSILLQEDMKREYPSTPQEAFAASQEGFWYARQLKELYNDGRVTDVSYDKTLPVHTAWDLGQADAQSIWFFQLDRAGNIKMIDYFERCDTSLELTKEILNQKGYSYGEHIWPHDARARDRAGITFEEQARDLNLFGNVLERHSILDGINLVRTTMSKMWFDAVKCKTGLQALARYKKKWNNQIGGFTSEEVHDDASHSAAAMRYLCAGLPLITNQGSVEEDFKALRSYWG